MEDLEFIRCSSGDGEQVVNVLRSSDDDAKIPQSILFLVEINDDTSSTNTLVLCWVDAGGGGTWSSLYI